MKPSSPALSVWKHEGLQLLRNPAQLGLLLLTLAGGIFSVHHGKSQMDGQREKLAAVHAREAADWETLLNGFAADTSSDSGRAAFHKAARPTSGRWWHGYHATWEPTPLSSLSNGQRDLYPYYFRLSGQSFYLQLFQNEIAHPQKLRAGHFDLAFVILYLFPLLIIALGYNLLSVEKERGTYSILRIQAPSVLAVLAFKGLFHFVLVLAMGLGLSCYGFALSGVLSGTLSGALSGSSAAGDWAAVFSWLAWINVYLMFWAALVLVVVSRRKGSGINALSLLGCWLLFVVVLPSLVNIAVAALRPIDQTHLTDLIRRTGMEETEVEALKAIREMAGFRPDLAPADSIKGPFLIQKGFAAFQENRRRISKPVVDAYKVEVERRNGFAEMLNFANPAVLSQDGLNALARSDLAHYWRFQDAMAPFHEKIAEFYIRPLFANRILGPADLAARPRYEPPAEPHPTRKVAGGLVHMLVLILAACALAWPGLRKNDRD